MIYFVSLQTNTFKEIESISVDASLEILDKLDLIAVDTETTGLDCHVDKLLLLQLGNKEIQIVVDLSTISILKYKKVLEEKDLILQNAKFDLKFLYVQKIIPRGKIWDTMLAEQVLYNGLKRPSNLAALCKKYLDVEMSKEIRTNIAKLGCTYDVIMYSARDVEFLHLIKDLQIKKAKDKEVIKAIKLENAFVKVLAYVEYCGIYLDKELWLNKVYGAKTKLDEVTKKLNSYVIDNNFSEFIDKQLDLFSTELKTTINWSSSKQVLPLFKKLRINVKSEENKSGESISEKIIIKQKDLFEIIPLYLEYQSVKKDFTTYGEKFLKHINPVTNRIHSDFTQLMVTSRLSSANPNLQNLPHDERTRKCFIPSKEDNILVIADYDGQEDRVFVNRSKEKKMIEFYNLENADGHSYVASLCFPEEIEETPNCEIKKNFPKLRQIAKSAKFAIHYSGTGYTIANNLNLSESEGERIYNAYLKAFPDINKYLQKVQALARRRGYIVSSTVTNRKVWLENFEDLKKKNDFKKLYEFGKKAANYPIQTESAEITKIAGIEFFNWILENNLFDIVLICNLIHDEIFTENPKELAVEVSNTLKGFMEKAGSYYCKIIPLTATPEITNKWEH